MRISASLAMTLSRSLHANIPELSGTITTERICKKYPRSMALSNFEILIQIHMGPIDLDIMRRALLYHQYSFDRTINYSSKSFSSKTNIEKYADIQINKLLEKCFSSNFSKIIH